MVRQLPRIDFLQAMFERLPKPVEVLDGVLYLTLLNRTFEQIHKQWLRNLTLTELKTDKDVGGQYGLHPSWYAIELSISLVL